MNANPLVNRMEAVFSFSFMQKKHLICKFVCIAISILSLLIQSVVSAQSPVNVPGAPVPPQSTSPAPPQASSGAGGDSLSPELFTGIVQGVLSTMMSSLGAQQGNGESIAQFIQRLSQTSNLFTPGSGDAVGKSQNKRMNVIAAICH